MTRPRPGEPLTPEQVQAIRNKPVNAPYGFASMGGFTREDQQLLCDTVEALRQSLVALRTERDEANKLLELRGVYECGSIQCPYEVQFRAAEAQRTEAEQALAALRKFVERVAANPSCGMDHLAKSALENLK